MTASSDLDNAGHCRDWAESARTHLLESPSAEMQPALERHLGSCDRCRAEFGSLLRVDRSIRRAYRALEQTASQPRGETIDRILRAARESPPAARLLRRIRRPVNTMLWIAVLVISLGGLSALAWGLYVLLSALKGS